MDEPKQTSEIRSIFEVEIEQEATPEDIEKAKKDFDKRIKEWYSFMYAIKGKQEKTGKELNTPQDDEKNFYEDLLDLTSLFNLEKGELKGFSGWWFRYNLGKQKERRYFENSRKINLNAFYTSRGLIYQFEGESISENDEHPKRYPLRLIPVYGLPSGKIIKLRVDVDKMICQWRYPEGIFPNGQIEYRNFELSLPTTEKKVFG
jgi:hypothetical protein